MRLEKGAKFERLMQAVGFALWELQELERTAADYAVIRVRGHRSMEPERAAALLASAERATFGGALTELEAAGVVPGAMATRLRALLDDRNWLVHRSRAGSRGILADPEAYAQLTERLERMSDRARELLKELAQEFEDYVVAQGVDRAQIDAESARLARAWGLLD